MVDINLTMRDGRTVTVDCPEPGSQPSAFLLGLPKAGSTLFFKIMVPICARAGLPFFSLQNAMHPRGIAIQEVGGGLETAFQPTGYAYGVRGFGRPLKMPAWADGRIVVLVRDPRDMLTSLYFSETESHRPPGSEVSQTLLEQFMAQRQRARAQTIDEYVLDRVRVVESAFKDIIAAIDGKAYKLFRYEDIIFDKLSWIENVLDYLELSAPKRFVAGVVERNDVRPSFEDPSSHVRRVTPGDYKDKLSPDVVETLTRRLGPLLARFDYVTPERPVAADRLLAGYRSAAAPN